MSVCHPLDDPGLLPDTSPAQEVLAALVGCRPAQAMSAGRRLRLAPYPVVQSTGIQMSREVVTGTPVYDDVNRWTQPVPLS